MSYLGLEARNLGSEPPKLLLVDDDPVQLEMSEGALGALGFRVLTHLVTSSGDVGSLTERLAIKRYDLIVYDTDMGLFNGYEVAAEAAVTSGNPAPYVGWSHQRDHDKERKWGEAGARDFWQRSWGFDMEGYQTIASQIFKLLENNGN